MQNKHASMIPSLVFSTALGVSLLLVSMLRIWGDSKSAAFGGKIIETTMAQPIWGTALALHLFAFAATLLLVHSTFGLLCLLLARTARIAWPHNRNSLSTWTLLWFVMGVMWIMVANATWFPWSSLGEPYARLARTSWLGLSPLVALSILISSFVLVTVTKAIVRKSARLAQLSLRVPLAIGSLLLIVGSFAMAPNLLAKNGRDGTKPNVILVGIDSLRVDIAMGTGATEGAPAVHDFPSKSTVFTNTMTPLARTFPSWVSIVSGRNPHTTGAVINLFPRNRIEEGETLPKLLRRSGYKTIYAIDEVRFSNLDKSYGFDEMIAPPIGATDFILGFFSDTPLSNLLVNTRLGSMLFPYAYANRAAAVTYDPQTFIDRLDREADFDQPTFLAVHMTLAHWPFSWSSSEARNDKSGNPDTVALYKQAVGRVDTQFSDLMSMLRKRGALENAIVVLLSDHGESLGEVLTTSDTGGSDPVLGHEAVYGHGTNVFAEHQYQVVLGFQTFGQTPLKMRGGLAIGVPASLEDVAPTLADALGLEPESRYDGISLLPFVNGAEFVGQTRIADRIRFSETEFNPFFVGAGAALSTSALQNASEYYHVDPKTDRVMVKEEAVSKILADRQYAASRKGSMLASIPAGTGPGRYVAYIERPGAMPRWLDDNAITRSAPEVTELWHALRRNFPATRDYAVLPPGLQPLSLTAQVAESLSPANSVTRHD